MQNAPKILLTGGAGYVGAVLVPKLLDQGYSVRVLDLFLYGDGVFGSYGNHPRLEQIKGDIRDTELVRNSARGCDTVIHFACISNDPSCDLDPRLTKSINLDAFRPLVRDCKDVGVQRFIFASSASVYGISDQPNVTEDHPRLPVTDYNRYKADCEDILDEEQAHDFATVVIRPATVCGYSPRLRLDLTVNILTNHAVNKGLITVFGGSQYRPNIHIQDLTDLYVRLVDEPTQRISGKTFNVSYENRTVQEIAETVKGVVETAIPNRPSLPIEVTESNDVRSYRLTSEKIARELEFLPTRSVEYAVQELCCAFNAGQIPDPLTDRRYYNINMMTEIGLV